ncbi:hypothetical protein Ancab_020639 [Ancistrocladus abbreviatus]
MAISAFFIHKRSVDQILDRLIEIRHRNVKRNPVITTGNVGEEEEEEWRDGDDNEEIDFDGEGDGDINRQMWAQSLSRSLEEHALRRYAVSSSVPNVGLSNNRWLDDRPNYGGKSRGGKSQASSSSDDKVKLLSNGLLPLERGAWIPSLRPPPCPVQKQAQCTGPNSVQLGVLLLGLVLLSIGTGGIRPSNIPFGVDQFDFTTEKRRRGINSYYNWYYTTFTVVVFLALTVVVYVQDSISWLLGFGILAILMFGSIILILLGTKLYVYLKSEGSIFSSIAQVFVAAYKKCHLELPNDSKVEVYMIHH